MFSGLSNALSNLFTAPARARKEAYDVPEFEENPARRMVASGGYFGSGYGAASGRAMWGGFTTGEKSPGGLSASGAIRTFDHQTIRLNARDAMYDSPHARGIVERFGDTVADVGLLVKPEPVASMVGTTEQEAETWAENVKSRFHIWAKSKDSSIDGVNNLYQTQKLYANLQHRDNDMFARLNYSDDPELISPLQVGLLDPDQIVGNGYTCSYGPQYNYDGINRDENGREVSYNVMVWNGKRYETRKVQAVGDSGRIHMLHGYHPENPGQGRGYSRITHALQEFEQLTDFSQAQIEKAINQSQMSMQVIPSKDSPASNPVEQLMQMSSGPLPADVLGANPVAAPSGADIVNFTSLYEATFRNPGSMLIANLKEGEKLAPIDNTAPAESYDKFVNAFVSHLAASVSMPLEVVLMKFQNNYSASRATLVLFWRVVEQWRREMAADFLDPIYRMWLSEEIAAGRISAPGFSDPRMRAAWCSCRWQGVPMPNIDPVKEVTAAEKRAVLGQETLEDGAQNYNGSSWRMNNQKNNMAFAAQELPKWHSGYGKEEEPEDDDDDMGGSDDE